MLGTTLRREQFERKYQLVDGEKRYGALSVDSIRVARRKDGAVVEVDRGRLLRTGERKSVVLRGAFALPVTVDCLRDVYFVHLARGERGFAFHDKDGGVFDISSMGLSEAHFKAARDNAPTIERGALIGDRFTGGNMCHVAADHLARAEFLTRELDPDIRLFGYASSWPWARTLGNWMGFDIAYLPEGVLVHFEELYLFSNAFDGPPHRPVMVHSPEMIARMKKVRDERCFESRFFPERIYLSRLKDKLRSISWEGELAKKLAADGFAILNAGDLTVEEQAMAAFNAECVVAPHGAALTNILFCRDGTRVFEIFNADFKSTTSYRQLSGALGLDYGFTEVSGSASEDAVKQVSQSIR